jgi:hypothetical protein
MEDMGKMCVCTKVKTTTRFAAAEEEITKWEKP